MVRHALAVFGFLPLLALATVAAAEEKVLFQKASPYNTVIVTENERGLRTLRFEQGGARQSVVKVGDPDHLELPYASVMPVGLAFVEKPRQVLVVGLGGGTVPSFLHKHFPSMHLDVVDIDPVVVQVAKEFFGFREDDRLRAYAEDGRKFIEQRPRRYDIIFLDAFGAENVPYHLATREFLESVRAALTPEGIVVGNIWSRSSNPLYDSMVRTYQEVFPEVTIFHVRGVSNRIVVGVPRRQPVDKQDLTRRAREISTQSQFGFDLGDVVNYGFREAAEERTGGRVLRDEDQQRKAG
ncbi:MAG: fused MFS/spermidine synthase [Planctomycetota bacterium]|nr:fused MFS/spermidine synthase [Planctomycetota bacterium]